MGGMIAGGCLKRGTLFVGELLQDFQLEEYLLFNYQGKSFNGVGSKKTLCAVVNIGSYIGRRTREKWKISGNLQLGLYYKIVVGLFNTVHFESDGISSMNCFPGIVII